MWQHQCHFNHKNPVHHSITKHIDIRPHFLIDHVRNGDIDVQFVSTEDQFADVFTKPLDEAIFDKVI